MKQGLSLRVSQHLALTPQLQQSIRLLQLSTLELTQEVEQMLDENPFLEVSEDAAVREEFGVEHVNTPVSQENQEFESATNSIAGSADDSRATSQNDSQSSSESSAESSTDSSSEAPLEESWDGDGSVETAPDDSEWGGDAPPRKNNADDSDADTSDLARGHESLQDHLHRQALGLRLSEVDQAALHFLIESLNDDGYLEDSLAALAAGLAGDDLVQAEEVEERFAMALKLLHHMEPAGVGARNLAECLSLQLLDCKDCEETRAAMAVCKHPMELLAKRDVKRLAYLCGFSEAVIKGAIAVIGRLDPKPGRRFVNVERNLIVPDVIVTKAGRGFKVALNREVMPRLRVHDIYANALKQHKGQAGPALQQRLQEARWFIKNIQQRFDTILRVSSAIVERQKLLHPRRAGHAPAGAARNRRRTRPARVDDFPRHHRQIHEHALRHLRAEIFFRLGARHRNWRQRVEHGRARADQTIRRVGKPEKAAQRQPDFRDAERARHRMRPPHGR
jgi:RNA polymerase sigma-54 factor